MIAAKKQAIELRDKVNNEHPEICINRLSWHDQEHTSVKMMLDAEGSDVPMCFALISVVDLPQLAAYRWLARKLDDGKYYAFTETPVPMFMHECLTPKGMVLSEFVHKQTLDHRTGQLSFIDEDADAAAVLDGLAPVQNVLMGNMTMQTSVTKQMPWGRWMQRWKHSETGVVHTLNAKIKGPDQTDKDNARGALQAKILAMKLKSPDERFVSWAAEHPDARRLRIAILTAQCFVTRNTKWIDKEVEGGAHLGTWLRGRIVKHTSTCWCAQTSEEYAHHFETEAQAERKLLSVNSAPNVAVNTWTDTPEGRKIMLDEEKYMLVDKDRQDVIDALAQYQWTAETYKLSDGTEGYVACNVNRFSKWLYAETLVAWTVHKDLKAGPRMLVWPTPQVFLAEVSVEREGARALNDLRAAGLIIHQRKGTLRQNQMNRRLGEAKNRRQKRAQEKWAEEDAKEEEDAEEEENNVSAAAAAAH
jgi:hypothetical protein